MIDERGWTAASPRSVAREAGLTTSELYDEFRSLEHCYVAVYDEMAWRLGRLVEQALAARAPAAAETSWERQLEVVFDAVLWFFALEPALARTCLVEVMFAGPAARARRDRALEQFTTFVEGLRLAHGDPMPAVAAEVIVLGTTELIHKRVARGESERLPELLPELRELWTDTVSEHADPGGGVLALDQPAA